MRWNHDGHRALDALAGSPQPVFARRTAVAMCLAAGWNWLHVQAFEPPMHMCKSASRRRDSGHFWDGRGRSGRWGGSVHRRFVEWRLPGEMLSAAAPGVFDHLTPTGSGMAVAEEVAAGVLRRGPRTPGLRKR